MKATHLLYVVSRICGWRGWKRRSFSCQMYRLLDGTGCASRRQAGCSYTTQECSSISRYASMKHYYGGSEREILRSITYLDSSSHSLVRWQAHDERNKNNTSGRLRDRELSRCLPCLTVSWIYRRHVEQLLVIISEPQKKDNTYSRRSCTADFHIKSQMDDSCNLSPT